MSLPQKRRAEDDLDSLQSSLEMLDSVQEGLEKLEEDQAKEVLILANKYGVLRKPLYSKRQKLIDNIPEFWLQAMLNHPVIAHTIEDKDKDILKSLRELTVADISDDVQSGFKVVFGFRENEYFENPLLEKEIRYGPAGPSVANSTSISWKEGKDPTQDESSTLDTDDKNARGISFFQWFSSDDDDTELAEVFKEELWENPLKYFMSAQPVDDDPSESEYD